MSNKDNPLSVYAIAGHIAFSVITPLLLFIGGGTWLADKLNLPEWTKIIFVLLGILGMIGSLTMFLRNLIAVYDDKEKEKREKPDPKVLNAVKKERDYYYDD